MSDWWDNFKTTAVQHTGISTYGTWQNASADELYHGIQGRLQQVYAHILSQLNTYRYKAEQINDPVLRDLVVSEVDQLKYDIKLNGPVINSITQKADGNYIYSDGQLKNIAQTLLADESRVNAFYTEHRNMFDRISVFGVNAKQAVDNAMRELTEAQRQIIEGKGGDVSTYEKSLVRNIFYGNLLNEYAKDLPPGVTVGLRERLRIDQEYIDEFKPGAVQRAVGGAITAGQNAVNTITDAARGIADAGKRAADDAMSFFEKWEQRMKDLFGAILKWGIIGVGTVAIGGVFLIGAGIKAIRRK